MDKLNRKNILILMLFFVTAPTLYFVYSKFMTSSNASDEEVASVDTYEVTRQDIRSLHIFQGQFDYYKKIEIKSSVTAELIKFNNEIGEYVEENQLLVELNSDNLQNQRAEIEMEIRQLNSWLNTSYPALQEAIETKGQILENKLDLEEASQRALVEALKQAQRDKLTTDDEVESAEQELVSILMKSRNERAQFKLEKADIISRKMKTETSLLKLNREKSLIQNRFQDYHIRTPIKGVVTALSHKFVAGGYQQIESGDFLISITDMESKILKIPVPSAEISRFTNTENYSCIVPRLTQKIPCKLISLSMEANKLNNSDYSARFLLLEDSSQIQPGETGEIHLSPILKNDVLTVPIEFLVRRKAETGIIVIDHGETKFIPLVLGIFGDQLVEVKSGLTAGLKLVTPRTHHD